MDKELFDMLFCWQSEGGSSRSFSIDVGKAGLDRIDIWVYDYNLMEGAFINTLEELEQLNLKQKKIDKLKKDLEEAING